MADKKERNDLTTPKGTVAGFTAIQKPSYGTEKFPIAEGEFVTTLAFDPDTISDLVEELESVRDQHFEKVLKDNPKVKKQLKKVDVTKPEFDDDGEETGRVLLKFKQKAKIKSNKTGETFSKKVAVYDAKGKKVTKQLRIGAGSVLKANFEPVGYYMAKDKEVGVTLRLRGVQIIKYVEHEGGGASAESMGFEAEEDDDDAFDSDEFDGDDASEGEDQTSGDDDSEEDDEDF